jgi:glutamyl-tRNA synthetase
MKVRTRMAPSPTGYAHLGMLSRFLLNYALAKKHGGQFIWRNEDTDRTRFVEDALEYNMKWIREFGLDWDEGPDKGGPYAPYTQTERLDLYKEASDKLIENGYAYKCFCSQERLEELREQQTLAKQRTKYDGKCRNLTKEEVGQKVASGESYTIRIKVPENRKIEFYDVVTKNNVVWDSSDVDDMIIVKSNGIPTYHLAAMYDDIVMDITHVFRGSEWLSSTPIHVLIYEGLGIKKEDMPSIGHFTVILDPNTPGKKFSKRSGSFRINGLPIRGYLKPAILNYLMLLGWAPKDNREVFTLEEYVDAFDIEGLQKSNPTWDNKKMDWFNGIYLRNLTLEELTAEFKYWIEKFLTTQSEEDLILNLVDEGDYKVDSKERMYELIELAKTLLNSDESILQKQLALLQERAVNFWHVLQQLEFFYKKPENINWDIKQLDKIRENIPTVVEKLNAHISKLPDDSSTWWHQEWEQGVRKISEELNAKAGDIFMVLRVAIVGGPYSPPMFEAMQLLGKEECLNRLKM